MIYCQIEYATNKPPLTLRPDRNSDKDKLFAKFDFAGRRMNNPGEGDLEWTLEKGLEKVLLMVLDTLNPLLENIPHALLKTSSSNNENQWAVSHTQLANTMLDNLEQISELIFSRFASIKAFDKEIIKALRNEIKNNNPFPIMKLLTQFMAPWIKNITFIVDNKAQENLVRLLDINYPPELIPLDSLTSLMSTNDPKNDLFIKKTEYLYFAYNINGRYNHLYHDKAMNALLYDASESYSDFCKKIKNYAVNKNTNHFVFFNKEAEAAGIFPSKLIMDLFAKSQLSILKPIASDYETLIRRMAAKADITGLSQLLNSPVLDVVNVNMHAKNSKKQTAIDLIGEYQKKYPALGLQYSQCEALLESFQPQDVLGKRSGYDLI